MTPAQFKTARQRLGLTIEALAARLRLNDRTVRRYEQSANEKGHRAVPGPVQVLMELWTNPTTDTSKRERTM